MATDRSTASPTDGSMRQHNQPSLSDLRSIAVDIKDTMSAAITDLRHDIQALMGQVQEMEKNAAHQGSTIRLMNQTV